MIFYLLTFFVFSQLPLEADIRVTSNHLPSFDKISTYPPFARKQYLDHLVRLINKKEYDFLDEILLMPGKKLQKHCFSGIYGEKSLIKSPHKTTRRACKQDIEMASIFFVNTENKHLWEKFRIKIGLLCMKSKKCRKFLKKQQNLQKMFFSGLNWGRK